MFANVKQLGRRTTTKLLIVVCALVLSGCVSHDRQALPLPVADGSNAPKKNVTIALLGATGLAGGYILDQALAEGYDIRALARTPLKLERYEDQITIVKGDALDPASIEALLRESHVVISALGPVKADGEAAKMLNASVTAELLELMPKYNIQRYILVSGAAVVIPGDDRNFIGWLMRQLVFLGLHSELEDKQAEYQLLADSSVQWTLVRCPLIEDQPFTRSPRASLDTPTSFTLRAGELAYFVVNQVDSNEFVGKGPFLNSD
jgi:putative NADH-flavin reductase